MRFLLPGEDIWSEGKLVLESGSLCLRSNGQSRRSRIHFPFLKKDKEAGFFIPIRSIRDVIREESGIIIMKHTGDATFPTDDPSSESELLLSTQLAADEQVLNKVERELIMSMDAYKFNVYFTHAGEGGVLSMEKNVELEKGLLKIFKNALWIIGRNSHKRIAWDDIVNVEQKKRSRYKGTEYGAISLDYFGAGAAVGRYRGYERDYSELPGGKNSNVHRSGTTGKNTGSDESGSKRLHNKTFPGSEGGRGDK
ncbi:MAG: hypothetical protein LRZ87_03435 [Methanocellales archaeon]|nr:hypothetical protein [Methanocellales archaeon]